MAAVAIAEPLTLFGVDPDDTDPFENAAPAPGSSEDRPASPAARADADEPTLAQLVGGAWTTLRAHRAIACLICGSSMEPIYGAHALPVAGRCRDCGTELS